MTDLTNFEVADLVHDSTAARHNFLLAGVLRAEVANTETISATKELADSDCQFQIITPSGADRTVELPPEATTNHVHVISVPAGATYDVPLKDDSGSTTYCTLDAGEWALCIPDGTSWLVIYSGNLTLFAGRINTQIDGMKLTWNSATSITVGVGACYAENGDWIDVTSALVKSSLSLSASTWYHVYVYLSSGAPAAEVVTTAPVAWKGTAYSKTGDTSRRYVGSIKSDGSGNVYEFLHSPFSSQILYAGDSDLDASPFRVLNTGTATTATEVDMSAVIPVTSKIGIVRLVSTGSVLVDFGPTSNVTGPRLNVGSTAQQTTIVMAVLTTNRGYYYKFASAPSGGAFMDVYGYAFER